MSFLAVGLFLTLPHGPHAVENFDRFKGLRMVARDGVMLIADGAKPKAEGRFPVLLERTRGDRADALRRVLTWAGQGYVVVVQSCRGKGLEDSFAQEAKDGEDTIAWVARQPWCDGRVGMIGSGYAAMTQVAAATRRPPALRGIAPRNLQSDAPDGDLRTPMLLVSDWGDTNRLATMRLWESSRRLQRKDDWLIYGPAESNATDRATIEDFTTRFYDSVLRGRSADLEDSSHVMVYVSGLERWSLLDGWPSSDSKFETLYLAPQTLRREPEVGEGLDPKGMGKERRLDRLRPSVLFASETYSVPTVIAGPFEVRLFLRSGFEADGLVASLVDVAPDGTKTIIGKSNARQLEGVRVNDPSTIRGDHSVLLRPLDAARRLDQGHRLGLLLTSEVKSKAMEDSAAILMGTVTPSRITFRSLNVERVPSPTAREPRPPLPRR